MAFGELAEGGGVAGQFLGPVGDHHEHREVLGPGRERGEPAQGLLVGPVGVVQDQHGGGLLHGDAGHQPVQAVAYPGRVGHAAARVRHQAEGRGDDVVPAAQDGARGGLVVRGQDGLHELAYDVERHAVLLLAAACGEHGAAVRGGAGADLAEQCGLAHAGGCGEGEQTAAPGGGGAAARAAEPVQGRLQGFEFGVPFEQDTPCVAHLLPSVGHD